MKKVFCLRCLMLWNGERVGDRASCPNCGGALRDHGH